MFQSLRKLRKPLMEINIFGSRMPIAIQIRDGPTKVSSPSDATDRYIKKISVAVHMSEETRGFL